MTIQSVEALRAALDDGGRIAYAADLTLATLQVVVDPEVPPDQATPPAPEA